MEAYPALPVMSFGTSKKEMASERRTFALALLSDSVSDLDSNCVMCCAFKPPGSGPPMTRWPQIMSKAKSLTEAFLKNSIQKQDRHNLKAMLTHKAVILGYARPKKSKRNSKKAKGLNARQKRAMKVFQIKPEDQRYQLFLPLHELWKQYITDLLVLSKCPSYVGTTGILVQEFKHVFKIITEEDKLKVIPKRNSVFAVEINGFVSHIYGNKFEQRASERSAKKFKVKGTIDL
ncbi:Ribonuclease P protein subunit p29 [Nibea albiflora]|uniref:Ribonuclease P protein subunit p29 n=1 Tax=Nibea albiflora TaxID=240163 RepID=A0ACB7EG66_NIBAL|nr:Ribonuclease P protein subunit p29 [Nibea albiflora]